MEEDVIAKGNGIVLTQIFNDARPLIGFGFLFVGVLSIFKMGITLAIFISILTGLLLFLSSFNGTRLKLYGRISSILAALGLSYLGYITDQYVIGLVIFYCAIIISFEVIRS